jgi:hypothetical protein
MTDFTDRLGPARIPIAVKKKGKAPDAGDRLASIREVIQMIHWALEDYHRTFHAPESLAVEQACADLIDNEAAKIDATARHLGIVK